MSIRRRLLTLVIGGVVPLLVVGLALLWSVWRSKEQQLNEGLEQQAELAAVLFDHWLEAQNQTLRTVALRSSQGNNPTSILEVLQAARAPRPYWTDLRVLDAAGKTVTIEPATAEDLPSGLAERLLVETRGDASRVETDWTKGAGRYSLVVAVPVREGGAVVGRIDGSSLKQIFQGVTLPERALVTLLDPERRIIYRSQGSQTSLGFDLADSTIDTVLNDRNTGLIVRKSSIDNVERVYGLARAGTTGYSLLVGVPSSVLYAPAWRQLSGYGLVGLLVVFGSMAAALLIAQSIARPVRLLGFAAQQFGEGNFSARVPSTGEDELGRLGVSFNGMAERLEKREAHLAELDTLKSEFVSRASHELRTPLTTIKALTRLLLRDGLSDEKRREYIETISVECDRQIDLVLNLLDLARIEGGVFRITHERVDVNDVITTCVASASRNAEKRGHQLRFEQDRKRLFVCADPKTLRRVLSNLIENSIKYTADGGSIVLAAREEGKQVTISVKDNGRGIPPEDMPVLFDKFHRGRPAPHSAAMGNPVTDAELLEDADVSGVGLGLYLARNVTELMGGRITVESEVGRGSTFTVHMPSWRDGGCEKPPDEVDANV